MTGEEAANNAAMTGGEAANDAAMNEAEVVDNTLYVHALAYGIADRYGVLDMKTHAKGKTMTYFQAGHFQLGRLLRWCKGCVGDDSGYR